PVVGAGVTRGRGRTVFVGHDPTTAKRIDGEISDWKGKSSRFAGTSVYSGGEYIYQDHLFDAFGAADEQSVATFEALEAAQAIDPNLDRPDGLYQFFWDLSAGAGPLQHGADLLELRVAADQERVRLLARTNLMSDKDRTAILVLADTAPGKRAREVPFSSGLVTERADVALLLSGGRVLAADLSSGKVTEPDGAEVATNPAGYTNAIEASLPAGLVSSGSQVRLAVATGTLDKKGDLAPPEGSEVAGSVANVAFRSREPVTASFDRHQAIALYETTIDPFFADVELDKLHSGYSERYEPGAGYHVRSFEAPEHVSEEAIGRSRNRDYGVYLPTGSQPSEALPLTTFLHGSSGWPGASNHLYAAILPGLTRDFGDLIGGIVLFPKDRQVPTKKASGFQDGNDVSSALWVSESLVELNAVWKDALATFDVDENRQYLTGYSMGGIATYLIPALMPDRFAAVHVTAGAIMDDRNYPSLNFPGQVMSPWPQFSALKVIENFLHVPVSVFAGATDEATPWLENVEPVRRYHEMGYRHRLYTFPGDHYHKGVMDEWAEPARYLAASRRRRTPARVVLVRDMKLERAVEIGNYKPKFAPQVDFSFDSSFWVGELTPSDAEKGRAVIDVRSFAISDVEHQEVLEAGGPIAPGQTGPYAMEGLAWDATGALVADVANGFTASLTGTKGVRLDLDRMALDIGRDVAGRVKSDHAVVLRLDGGWDAAPAVSVDDKTAHVSLAGGVLEIRLPAGRSIVTIRGSRGTSESG
ncbi:MAG: hypothetical protein ACRDJJ_06400, partial [Actinomycetota bacterium]